MLYVLLYVLLYVILQYRAMKATRTYINILPMDAIVVFKNDCLRAPSAKLAESMFIVIHAPCLAL